MYVLFPPPIPLMTYEYIILVAMRSKSVGNAPVPKVVYIHGMLQVNYYNQPYQVPIHVYIPPDYPVGSPFCYVVPNGSMYIIVWIWIDIYWSFQI